MADLQTLIAELEALKAVQRSGRLRVRYEGPNGAREVTYQTGADLARAIAAAENEIATLQGGVVRTINVRSKSWS